MQHTGQETSTFRQSMNIAIPDKQEPASRPVSSVLLGQRAEFHYKPSEIGKKIAGIIAAVGPHSWGWTLWPIVTYISFISSIEYDEDPSPAYNFGVGLLALVFIAIPSVAAVLFNAKLNVTTESAVAVDVAWKFCQKKRNSGNSAPKNGVGELLTGMKMGDWVKLFFHLGITTPSAIAFALLNVRAGQYCIPLVANTGGNAIASFFQAIGRALFSPGTAHTAFFAITVLFSMQTSFITPLNETYTRPFQKTLMWMRWLRKKNSTSERLSDRFLPIEKRFLAEQIRADLIRYFSHTHIIRAGYHAAFNLVERHQDSDSVSGALAEVKGHNGLNVAMRYYLQSLCNLHDKPKTCRERIIGLPGAAVTWICVMGFAPAVQFVASLCSEQLGMPAWLAIWPAYTLFQIAVVFGGGVGEVVGRAFDACRRADSDHGVYGDIYKSDAKALAKLSAKMLFLALFTVGATAANALANAEINHLSPVSQWAGFFMGVLGTDFFNASGAVGAGQEKALTKSRSKFREEDDDKRLELLRIMESLLNSKELPGMMAHALSHHDAADSRGAYGRRVANAISVELKNADTEGTTKENMKKTIRDTGHMSFVWRLLHLPLIALFAAGTLRLDDVFGPRNGTEPTGTSLVMTQCADNASTWANISTYGNSTSDEDLFSFDVFYPAATPILFATCMLKYLYHALVVKGYGCSGDFLKSLWITALKTLLATIMYPVVMSEISNKGLGSESPNSWMMALSAVLFLQLISLVTGRYTPSPSAAQAQTGRNCCRRGVGSSNKQGLLAGRDNDIEGGGRAYGATTNAF